MLRLSHPVAQPRPRVLRALIHGFALDRKCTGA
jgi:hypothetical protein